MQWKFTVKAVKLVESIFTLDFLCADRILSVHDFRALLKCRKHKRREASYWRFWLHSYFLRIYLCTHKLHIQKVEQKRKFIQRALAFCFVLMLQFSWNFGNVTFGYSLNFVLGRQHAYAKSTQYFAPPLSFVPQFK